MSGSRACWKRRITFAVAATSPSAAVATASGSIRAIAPAGASLTASAITAACRPGESRPPASAAVVFGSTPDRSVRAVRTVRAASAEVWCPTAFTHAPAERHPS